MTLKKTYLSNDVTASEFPGEYGLALNEFLTTHLEEYSADDSLVLHTGQPINILNALRKSATPVNCIVNLKRVNDVRWINKLFQTINHQLPVGGIFVGCVETPALRKQRILKKFPWGINYVYFTLDFIFKRIFPKIPLLKDFYFFVTSGRNRVISQAESLGRLYYCGFEMVEFKDVGRLSYFVVRKRKTVMNLPMRTYGPIFKMKRVGKGGKIINVYKVRTMCAYSEYLQEYVYELNNLKVGGKINNDFRITTIGKYLRRSFLDELPMLYNVMRGDLKLVGVRPISEHYLSLYDQELRDLRLKVKPGLIPPFYADMPKTLEQIIESEKKYIKMYLKKPLATDSYYFVKVFVNIAFKRARSN